MSESMTVEQAMEFVGIVKSLFVYDPPWWKKAFLVLADEVERLRYQADKTCIDDAREEIDRLSKERDGLRRQNGELLAESATHVGSGNKAVRRIKAAAVREFAEQTGDHYVINMAIDYNKANQIEGGA